MSDAVVKIVDPGVRVRSVGKARTKGAKVQQSHQIDPFEPFYGDPHRIIAPRFNPFSLASLTEASDILGRAITAMENNIDGFGWELQPAAWIDDKQATSPEAKIEKALLTRLFNYPNDKMENLTGLRQNMRRDRESIGCGYWEIIRNMIGEIAEIHLLPAISMRLVSKDSDYTEYPEFILDDEGNYEQIPRQRRFGYFAQISQVGKPPVYFKEFGDPRIIDFGTGKPTSDANRDATEVIAFPIYSSYDAYGLPRWLGSMMDIIGSRKAGHVNYLFFDNKMIPPLVVTVSGGSLTKEAITRLNDVVNKEIRGVENFHNILVLDATPASTSAIEGEKVAPVKIEVKPLTEFIQKDALFREYRADIRKTVRAQFGLPGMFTGDNDDYTRATAAESTRVVEEQVCEPDRRSFDYIMMRTIFASLQIRYWNFHSLGAKTSNDTEILNAMAGVAEALPVGVIQEAVAEARNVPIEIDPELYNVTLAEFKSKFAPQMPTFGMPSNTPDPQPQDQGEQIVKSLIELRKRLADRLDANGIPAADDSTYAVSRKSETVDRQIVSTPVMVEGDTSVVVLNKNDNKEIVEAIATLGESIAQSHDGANEKVMADAVKSFGTAVADAVSAVSKRSQTEKRQPAQYSVIRENDKIVSIIEEEQHGSKSEDDG